MQTVESKLPRVATTIFTVMSKLAEENEAINLSQGFPDFQPPSELVESVIRSLQSGHNQYAPMIGVAKLRSAIAELVLSKYGLRCDTETEITVTAGATEALFAAINAVVRRNDEVIVFDPAYDSYEPAISLAGGRAIRLPLTSPDFSIDWERLASRLCDRTRLIVLNSPHNPSGAVLTATDFDRLAELIRPYPCYVLSDEVYEHIVFDDRLHTTVLGQPELAQKSFAVFSFGKTFHATGWKIGYCIAPLKLTEEFRKVHQFLMFATTTPLQHGIAEYLRSHPEHWQRLSSFYSSKRDYFRELMQATRFELLPVRGTYFQLADYSRISASGDVDFARRLTVEHAVAAIPVSVFYEQPPASQRLIRFCFAKKLETLEQAAARLAAV